MKWLVPGAGSLLSISLFVFFWGVLFRAYWISWAYCIQFQIRMYSNLFIVERCSSIANIPIFVSSLLKYQLHDGLCSQNQKVQLLVDWKSRKLPGLELYSLPYNLMKRIHNYEYGFPFVPLVFKFHICYQPLKRDEYWYANLQRAHSLRGLRTKQMPEKESSTDLHEYNFIVSWETLHSGILDVPYIEVGKRCAICKNNQGLIHMLKYYEMKK